MVVTPQVVPERGLPAAAEMLRVRQGYLALLVVQLCFGLFPVFGKLAFEAFSPRAVAGWRILTAALVMGVAGLIRHRRGFFPAWRDLPRLAVFGLLGVVLNQVLFLEGLSRSSAIHAGLIVCLIPVFVFLIATAMAHEHFERKRAVGIAVALAGSALLLVQGGRDGAGGSSTVLGDLLMVANGLAYAFYLVLSKPMLQRYPPLVVLAWAFLTSLWCVPLLLAFEGVTLVPEHASGAAWASLAFVLVCATWTAYLLVLYALARVSSSTAAVFNYLQPLVSATAAVLLLGESLSAGVLAASLLLLAGLWLVVSPRAARSPELSAAPPRSPPR